MTLQTCTHLYEDFARETKPIRGFARGVVVDALWQDKIESSSSTSRNNNSNHKRRSVNFSSSSSHHFNHPSRTSNTDNANPQKLTSASASAPTSTTYHSLRTHLYLTLRDTVDACEYTYQTQGGKVGSKNPHLLKKLIKIEQEMNPLLANAAVKYESMRALTTELEMLQILLAREGVGAGGRGRRSGEVAGAERRRKRGDDVRNHHHRGGREESYGRVNHRPPSPSPILHQSSWDGMLLLPTNLVMRAER